MLVMPLLVSSLLVTIISLEAYQPPFKMLNVPADTYQDTCDYMKIICCGINSLIYVVMYTLDSFAIGVGAANVAMFHALLYAVIVRLPVSWFLSFSLCMDLFGIYYGQALSPVLPAIVGLLYFMSKKWECKTLMQTGSKGKSL